MIAMVNLVLTYCMHPPILVLTTLTETRPSLLFFPPHSIVAAVNVVANLGLPGLLLLQQRSLSAHPPLACCWLEVSWLLLLPLLASS